MLFLLHLTDKISKYDLSENVRGYDHDFPIANLLGGCTQKWDEYSGEYSGTRDLGLGGVTLGAPDHKAISL